MCILAIIRIIPPSGLPRANPGSSRPARGDTAPAMVLLEPSERVARVFNSFADADDADDEFYATLTPEARLEILLELVERERSALGQLGRPPNRIDILTSVSGVDFASAWRSRVPARLDDHAVSFIGLTELLENKRARHDDDAARSIARCVLRLPVG